MNEDVCQDLVENYGFQFQKTISYSRYSMWCCWNKFFPNTEIIKGNNITKKGFWNSLITRLLVISNSTKHKHYWIYVSNINVIILSTYFSISCNKCPELICKPTQITSSPLVCREVVVRKGIGSWCCVGTC